MIKAIINARLVLPSGLQEGTLLVEDGQILAAGSVIPPRDAEIIDAKGRIVGPGFIDIHCHGGGTAHGHENPAEAARHHLKSGTTSLLLSLAYSLTKEAFLQGIHNIRAVMEQEPGNLTGIHFEGPYTSPKYGARSEAAWEMNQDDYVQLFDEAKGLVYQCTYAPERPGARAFAQYAHAQGVKLAAGHTEMSPAILEEAISDGVTIITHLFDAMGCHLGKDSIRSTGIIQDSAADAVLARGGLFVEIICDSRAIHVKPSNLRLALRAAGPDHVVLITDATIRPHDPSQYPEDDYRSSPDLNFNEAGQLSGSRLTMDQACRNMKHYTQASIPDLFKMASTNAARAIGIDHEVGSLEVGKWANLVFCDDDMNLIEVYLRGNPVNREA